MNMPLYTRYSKDHCNLEQIIALLEEDPSSENKWEMIEELRKEIASHSMLLVPLASQSLEQMMEIEPFDLEYADLPDPGLLARVQLSSGGQAFCAFTSEAEMNKGPQCYSEYEECGQLFELSLKYDEVIGLILNPWSDSILLDKPLLSLIFSQKSPAEQSSCLYIDQGETAGQEADVLVCCTNPADQPEGEGWKALMIASEGELESAFEDPDLIRPGEIIRTSAPNLQAEAVYFADLPEELSEKSLSRLIWGLLDKAAGEQMKTIALPAIGSEEGDLGESLPFAIIAAAGWLSAHPQIRLDVTVTCRKPQTYQLFYDYLFH